MAKKRKNSNYVTAKTEQAKRERELAEKRKKTKEELVNDLFPYFIYALIIAFVLIYSFIGIIPAMIIIPPIMLWFLNCRNWKSYVAYFVFVTIIYLLFTQVLAVPIK